MEHTAPLDEPEETSQTNAPEHTSDTGGAMHSEMSALVNVLAASIQGMQGSLGNAYQSMANNLKQSMEMTMAMSNMMEKLLLSSLHVKSRIERSNGKVRMTLMVENTSQFPLPTVSGKITLTRQSDVNQTAEDIRPTWLSSRVEPFKDPNRAPLLKSSSIYDQRIGGPELTLGPGTRWVEEFEWDLKTVEDWLVLVQAGFSSPGTGKRLTKDHECCIYVLDQYDVQWLSQQGNAENVDEEHEYECSMRISALRDILQVPAVAGVSKSDRFVFSLPAQTPCQDDILLTSQPSTICGRVAEISPDGLEAVCRIGVPRSGIKTTEAPLVEDTWPLALRIAQELQVLGK